MNTKEINFVILPLSMVRSEMMRTRLARIVVKSVIGDMNAQNNATSQLILSVASVVTPGIWHEIVQIVNEVPIGVKVLLQRSPIPGSKELVGATLLTTNMRFVTSPRYFSILIRYSNLCKNSQVEHPPVLLLLVLKRDRGTMLMVVLRMVSSPGNSAPQGVLRHGSNVTVVTTSTIVGDMVAASALETHHRDQVVVQLHGPEIVHHVATSVVMTTMEMAATMATMGILAVEVLATLEEVHHGSNLLPLHPLHHMAAMAGHMVKLLVILLHIRLHHGNRLLHLLHHQVASLHHHLHLIMLLRRRRQAIRMHD